MAWIPAGPAVASLQPVPDHLSFSQITRLSVRYDGSCPRAWAYEKLLGLKRDASPAMCVGRAIDKGVEIYFTRRIIGDEVASALVDALEGAERSFDADEDWPEKVDREAYGAVMRGALRTVLEEYAVALDVVPVAVQRAHEWRANTFRGSVPVSGYSDWIEADGTIVDLKYSGKPHWNAEGEWDQKWLERQRDQVASYWKARLAYAARGKGTDLPAPIVQRGRIVCVVAALNRKTPVVKWVDLEFDRNDAFALDQAAAEADATACAEVHPMRPGAHCGWCAYAARCRDDNGRIGVRTAELVG